MNAKRISILSAILLLVYLLVWNLAHSNLSHHLKHTLAQDFPALTYEDMKSGGFPFRFDFVLTKPKLTLTAPEPSGKNIKTEFESDHELVLSANVMADNFRLIMPKELAIKTEGSDKQTVMEFGSNNAYDLTLEKSMHFAKKDMTSEEVMNMIKSFEYNQPNQLKTYELAGDKKELINTIDKSNFSVTKKDKEKKLYDVKLYIQNYKIAHIGEEINNVPEKLREYVKSLAAKDNEMKINAEVDLTNGQEFVIEDFSFVSDYFNYSAKGDIKHDAIKVTFVVKNHELLTKVLSVLFNTDENVVNEKIKLYANTATEADEANKTPAIVTYDLVFNKAGNEMSFGKLNSQDLLGAFLGLTSGANVTTPDAIPGKPEENKPAITKLPAVNEKEVAPKIEATPKKEEAPKQ
ncbi:MAG: hypothetical protein J0G32_06820 [Alphaproteobacteria bacterium]|nr:hypothetical protein [Alphaproteobacteria bacterium]OJV15811.1 MAG: hypothetical protein BGO27_07855 [Alphaproteobacteria bacterium 33-17]